MSKIKLDILGLSSSQSQSGSFALILGEEKGNRRLPIIIGMFEAQAIAIEIERIAPNRPMTHDLFRSFADSFHFRVDEVLISDLREGVFYAKILCSDGEQNVEIDARPSDAIAIGLRFKAAIYTTENILSEAGIILNDDSEEQDKSTTAIVPSHEAKRAKTWQEELKDMSSERLQTLLDEALANEDYEKAAVIRDELNQRN